jgi:glycyl-tRNA synthetase beta chain
MPKQPAKIPAASATLLVELLTEELPPKFLRALSEVFGSAVLGDLTKGKFLTEGAVASTFATPRRLAVLIRNVSARSPDMEREIQGPSTGAPDQAVAGFARKSGVAVEALQKQQMPKGEIYVARVSTSGRALDAVLATAVEDALKRLPVPKLMRWGSGEAQFVRPVHGLVMLHGSRIVPGHVLGAESSNKTLGHRFLSSSAIVLKHADDYERALRDAGKVTVDLAGRRAEIVKQLERIAGGAMLVANDALLDEIAALVESPAVYAGEFDAGFLSVPEECLVLSMQQHQKYVPLRDRETGKLLPRFLFVSNLETKDPREIVRGNERVLRARLADAKFFYDQDRRTRLEARVPRLASVVYHNKLGSQLERVERIQLLAGKIAHGIGADPLLTGRAAWLSKADLLTDMVGEFPELQGTMGRYYAANDGEPKAVADAIEAHYRPRFAGDAIPADPVSVAVALADKLDALCGLFGIGQAPTGDKDPFGLRRAALGIIRTLVERRLALSLRDLIGAAFKQYDGRVSDAHADLESFLYDRLSGYLRDAGYTTLEVDSVVSLRPEKIYLAPRQLEAVRAFSKLPEAESLAAANKRVANILKQAAAKGETFTSAESAKLKEPAERELYSALAITASNAKGLYERGDFTGFLQTFAALKGPVDAFFDTVMVMAEDRELRQNRLALLAELRSEMNRVADLSKLAA